MFLFRFERHETAIPRGSLLTWSLLFLDLVEYLLGLVLWYSKRVIDGERH